MNSSLLVPMERKKKMEQKNVLLATLLVRMDSLQFSHHGIFPHHRAVVRDMNF